MKKFVSLLLISSLTLTSCSFFGNEESTVEIAENYTAVKTLNTTKDTITTTLDYSGVITANQTVNVISTLTAEVNNTYFEVGDTVNEGDLLFDVDTSNIEDQIRQLNAQLGTAQVGVELASNQANNISGGSYQSQIKQLETSIESAEKQVALAKDSYELQKQGYENGKVLFDNGIISKNDFDGMELGYNQAKSTYESAVLQLEQLQNTYNLTTNDILNESQTSGQLGIRQAESSRNTVQVQLDITRKMLEDAKVTSPISGIISYKGANENEYISTSSPAYSIVDMDTVLLNVSVSEKIINKINKGDTVDVYINTVQNEAFSGTIKSVSPTADQTSTYPIEIEINNPNHLIKPGMFANTSFILNTSKNTIVIPYEAILSSIDETYVYVNDNNTAKKVVVETGLTDGKNIEITSGLQVGDEIITTGQAYLTDGDTIKVVE